MQEQQDKPSTPEILDYQQASRLIGVCVGTLYAWVHQKRIPHIRIGSRVIRFRASELESWLESHAVKPGDKKVKPAPRPPQKKKQGVRYAS